jgi:hypothetical protein
MTEKTRSHGFLGRWFLRVVLFALGFTITAFACALYWSFSYAETPDPRWERPVLVCAGLLGGVLSAAFGKRFWISFISAL